jgi:hypothetical protein
MANKAGLFTCLLTLVALSVNLSAQIPVDIFASLESRKTGQGTVKIYQDEKIRGLVSVHLFTQAKMNGIMGYRISIFSNSGQEANREADLTRAKFISRYEDVKSHKLFEYPFYKVYVGDFRTKSEALKFLKMIEYDFPNAFIRRDMISFPD